jgi:hypothetical protein
MMTETFIFSVMRAHSPFEYAQELPADRNDVIYTAHDLAILSPASMSLRCLKRWFKQCASGQAKVPARQPRPPF